MPDMTGLQDGAMVAKADANLDPEDDLYKFVEITDEREVDTPDSGGERCYGVLNYISPEGEDDSGVTQSVGLTVSGISRVRCGSSVSISAGNLLEVEAGGTVAEYSAGSANVAVAIAREDGNDDEVISALIITGGDMLDAGE